MVFDPDRQLPIPPSTVNDELFDALVRHQIFLLRSVGTLRKETLRILDLTEQDVVRAVERSLGNVSNLSQGLRRSVALRRALAEIRGKGWDEVATLWRESMQQLAINEPRFTGTILTSVSPVQLQLAFPSNTLLRSIVASTPFEGRTLSEWARDARASDLRRIEDQIKVGLVQGEDARRISQRIVGTRVLRGRDGVTHITRNGAAALTRTMTNAISNFGRSEFFKANRGLFTQELYVAVLDGRTTAICRSLDGKVFELDEGPRPPLHLNCRSIRIATLDSTALGRRPMNPTTERGLLREFAQRRNLGGIRVRSDLPRGTRSAFDSFARRRVRELVGTVPSKVDYAAWIRRQSIQFQNDALGRTKALLFRRGGLTLDKYVGRDGDELNLGQIATKNRQAFIDAGLDPDRF